MPTHFLIGAGAGLVSAALFASAATEAALGGILFFLSPLPLCLAGLGWGRFAALLAALSATVVIAAGLGPTAAAVFALTMAAPIAVLVHLVLLARPVATPQPAASQGETAVGGIEWYPPGRLVAWAAVIAGLLAGLFVLLFGYDQETYRQSIATSLNNPAFKDLDPDGTVFTPETIENLTAVLAKALPGMLAITWLTIVLFNLWLAGFIVEASGRALRPWPNLHDIELPNVFVAVFAVAILVSLLPGVIGLLGTGLAGAMLFAYVLQGLAVIHVYSRGVPFRALLLAAVYLGILLLGWVALLVAIVGLGEPLFGWRARASSQPPKDNKTD
jgi:hypothetical protein